MRVATLLIAILAPALFSGGVGGIVRTHASLVLVHISVLDSRDRPVNGLSQTQFQILDNGREQPIRFFAHEDAPVSLAVILDASGSMTGKWTRAREMLASFCENLPSGAELFLVTVRGRPRLATDHTRDGTQPRNGLLPTQPHGDTAFL